jgi:hypothetical protein
MSVTFSRFGMVALTMLAGTAALAPVTGARPGDYWKPLHRPLHLPRLAAGTSCPISQVDRRIPWRNAHIFGGSGIGPGPVYPGLGSSGGQAIADPDQQWGGPWRSGKVFWYVLPIYRGPVLIRGRQLDGSQQMRFGNGAVPSPELRIHSYDSVGWDGQPARSRGIASSIRVLGSGCYGVQIDGTNFSRFVVFSVSTTG